MDVINLSNGEVVVANKVFKVGTIYDNVTCTNYVPSVWGFKIHHVGGEITHVDGRNRQEVERARESFIEKLMSSAA